jgi:type VI secretion system protein ImpB
MADKDKGSVAPKERVSIMYKSETGDQSEDVELPLKMLVMGDFTGKPGDNAVEERTPVNVNKDNFDAVVKSSNLSLNMTVKNTLDEKEGGTNDVNLKFDSFKDFSPDRVAEQVPELKQLLELRKNLQALKGPLGNVPAFRRAIQDLLKDETTKAAVMTELGIDSDKDKK